MHTSSPIVSHSGPVNAVRGSACGPACGPPRGPAGLEHSRSHATKKWFTLFTKIFKNITSLRRYTVKSSSHNNDAEHYRSEFFKFPFFF